MRKITFKKTVGDIEEFLLSPFGGRRDVLEKMFMSYFNEFELQENLESYYWKLEKLMETRFERYNKSVLETLQNFMT